MAEDAGLSLTVWAPLAGGFLSGKHDRGGASTEQALPPASRPAATSSRSTRSTASACSTWSAPSPRGTTLSPARVSIAWLLAQRAVTSVIVGARKIEQLADNIAASDLTLTEQDLAELDEVSRPPVSYPNWIQAAFGPARIPAANLA